jgi:hypothetical protein
LYANILSSTHGNANESSLLFVLLVLRRTIIGVVTRIRTLGKSGRC